MNAPLVSIIIPTYNRVHFLKLALESALSQSYKNIEIIISDDSTNFSTYHLLQPYLENYPHIRYYRNKKNIGGALNFIQGYQYSQGEYINFLMDDDLLHPDKIKIMLEYFLNDHSQEIKLVTSYRSLIDENGNCIPDSIYNQRRFTEVTILDGWQAGSSIISEFNWIGEPTTPLFRKKDLIEPFGQFCGSQYHSAVDMASWLTLLLDGNLVYIADTLSYLRMHSSNVGRDKNLKVDSAFDWMHMLFHCPRNQILKSPNDILQSIRDCIRFLNDLETLYFNQISQSKQQVLKFYKHCLRKYQEEIQ
ncbi:glycosyltransferase [Bacillus wiedmannii]|uniref:Glycosyltransferase n=1 Tax=Bacillus wiedmannii TaxID=1890302 RepID=A0A4U2MHV9_9BACI|nr:glycosyltransferase [Bacillus wiedmannii]TKH10398.1 glycosyltransferase [Bacillus wiedmannii]